MSRLSRSVSAIVAVLRQERLTLAAASLGYHAFNSLIPLVLFTIVGLSLTGELRAAARLFEMAAGVPAAETVQLIEQVIGDATGRTSAAAIALVILLWSIFRIFRAFHNGIVEVYGVDDDESILGQARDAALVFGSVVLAVVLLGVLGVALSVLMEGLIWYVVGPVLLFLALVAAFIPVYYFSPTTNVTVREVLPGAVFAAATWTLSGIMFRLYASTAQSVQLYGVAGGLLLLLSWLYVGGLVLLIGVALNAVLGDRVSEEHEWLPTPGGIADPN